MSSIRRRMALVAAAALAVGTTAWAEESTQQNQRIRELEAKIAALEAKQAQNSKDVAATIDSVLRDADRRSQLLATSGDSSAGYDNGFFLRSGDWVMRIGAQFQFRYVTNWRENTQGEKSDEFENGFEVRRMRFDLGGTAFTKDLEYFFQWESDRDSGNTALLEAWAKYMFADDWGLRVGQIKDLVSHEFIMSSKRQLAVDTSLVDALVGGGVGGYTQAATLIYGGYNKNNPLNVEAGLTDGANQSNTNFIERPEPLPEPDPSISAIGAPAKHVFDFGLAARGEYKVMGNWADYRDFTAKGDKEDLLVVGLGGDWSQGGDGNLFVSSLDAQYENPNGLGVYGAILYRYEDSEITGANTAMSNWGFLIQGSYLLTQQVELFARYDLTLYDENVGFYNGEGDDNFHEITIGANYYLGTNGSALHRAKITVDLTWLPNGAPATATGLGILDANAGENELVLRAQFQLLI